MNNKGVVLCAMCWLSALPLLPWPPDSYRFCCWMVCWRPNEASAPTARAGTACASAFARRPLRPDSRRRCYRFLMSDRRRPYAFTMPHPHGCTNDWRIVRLISSSSRMTAMMCLRTAGRSPWYRRRQFCDFAAGLSRRVPAPARIRGRALSGKGSLLLRWLSCLPTGSKERELYRAFPTL
mgnify:CR=1 FL=1